MTDPESMSSREAQRLQIAARLIARYGWQLLRPRELAERARAMFDEGEGDLERRMIAAYWATLHAAASGAEGDRRQNLAYGELARALAAILRERYPHLHADHHDDVLQSALERIFRSFASCREPAAFLAFAAYRLLDAVRVAQRQAWRAPEPLMRELGDGSPEVELADPRLPPPDARLIDRERAAAIERFLGLFLQAHPQATRQIEIQRLALIEELDNDQIARRLGISVGGVHTARSRFTSTLRAESRWRKLLGDLGIGDEEL